MHAILFMLFLGLLQVGSPTQANGIFFTSCDEVASGKSAASRNINELLHGKLDYLWSVNFFNPEMLSRILKSTENDLPNLGHILISTPERLNPHNPAATKYSVSEIAEGLDLFFTTNAKKISLPDLKTWAQEKLVDQTTEATELPTVIHQVQNMDRIRNTIFNAFQIIGVPEKDVIALGQIEFQNLNTIELGLVYGWIQEATDSPPINTAISLNLISAAKEFVTRLNDINVNEKDESGDTALHMAVTYGFVDVAALLLARKDVLINETDNSSMTALQLALEYDRYEIVKLFR